ncbi:MAG TPA: MBL fold metallo-hydrolase [Polyangiaceae bacterium]|jgi:L-ascorbate metabolism protein UlaG (beta-lactamase superfamily)
MRPEDLAWKPESLGHDAGRDTVRVQWLGTAGFVVEHDGHTLLIDPYVTRASLARCVVAPLHPDRDVIRRCLPRADAIVVGHSHFDHVLDVPRIARTTGARVFGSRSAAALCLAQGVEPDHVEVVEKDAGGEPVEREVGPFALRFIPSAHSRFALGRVPFPGDIADCSDVPMRTEAYKCGAVFGVEIRVAGRTLYHLGSAEIVDANIDVKNVDLLLMCVAGWTSSRDFPERVGHRLAPAAVLLSHWDDFFRSIDRPARLLPAMQMPRLVERLARASGGARVGTVPIFGEVWV